MSKKKHKHKMSKRKLRVLCINTFVLSAAAIITMILLFYFYGDRGALQGEVPVKLEDISEETKDDAEGDVFSEPDEIVYEPPEYDFQLDEITVEIPGVTGEYTVAFVNDLHMITDKEAGDVAEENLPAVSERYETYSVTSEGKHAEEIWPEIVKFLNYHDFDAVIFGGDMLDYCSHSNMEALSEGFAALKYSKEQLMYIRSDHDYIAQGGSVYTENDSFIAHAKLWDGDNGKACIDFGEFQILGINKSYQNLSEDRLDFLTDQLDEGKPVIVVTHVPFYSEVDASLEEFSMAVRNKIYYWNKENSTYCPDENTQEFIDRMYDTDSNVVQILAAHVHAAWDGIVANNVREHIFAPSFEGKIGIVHVTGTKDVPKDTGMTDVPEITGESSVEKEKANEE